MIYPMIAEAFRGSHCYDSLHSAIAGFVTRSQEERLAASALLQTNDSCEGGWLSSRSLRFRCISVDDTRSVKLVL